MIGRVITEELAPLFVDRFFEAANAGDIEEVLALIDAGMDINIRHPHHSRTILIEAARNGHITLSAGLISKGADVHKREAWANATALHFAAENLHDGICRQLLHASADVDAATARGRQALHLIALRESSEDELLKLAHTADALIAARCELNRLDDDDTAPLHYCVLNNNIALAQRLLEAGANVNVQTDRNVTPLHIAMLERHYPFADLLYAYGADDTILNYNGKAPTAFAPKRPHYVPPKANCPQTRASVIQKVIPKAVLEA